MAIPGVAAGSYMTGAPSVPSSVPSNTPSAIPSSSSSSDNDLPGWEIFGIVLICIVFIPCIIWALFKQPMKKLYYHIKGIPDPNLPRPSRGMRLPEVLALAERTRTEGYYAKFEADRLRREQARANRPDTPSSEIEMKAVRFQDTSAGEHAPPGQNYPATKPLPPVRSSRSSNHEVPADETQMRNLTPSPFVPSRTSSPAPYAQARTISPLPSRMTRWPGPPRVDSPVSSIAPSETPYDDDLQPNGQPWPAHSTDPRRFEGKPEKAARLNFF